jgi:hypothetical protein
MGVRGVRWKTVCSLAGDLPDVEEGRNYGVPALSVRGALVARQHEGKRDIVLKVGLDERAALCASNPETFRVSPELQNYSMMIVHLPTVDPSELRRLLVNSWRMSAPPSLVAHYDAGRGDAAR